MIHLLWTGGWDSTFRLLQILLDEKEEVQPHYIIDPRRKSHLKEIETMNTIRQDILNTYPHTTALFQNTFYFSIDDIEPNNEITEAYQNILKYKHLGDQHEWLSRYQRQHNIEIMEVAIEKAEIFNYEGDFSQFICSGYEHLCEHKPNYSILKKEFSVLFQRMNLPICLITKNDMLKISQDKGWMPFMEKTWFCFNPTSSGNPCGLCKPCSLAVKENFSWRFPWYRLFVRNITLIYCKSKTFLSEKPAPFQAYDQYNRINN